MLEKLVRAFNGDENFLMTELMKLDKSGGRGYVDIISFSQFFSRNAP